MNKAQRILTFLENSVSEDIEFSPLPTDPNEMLSLTSFARKATVD